MGMVTPEAAVLSSWASRCSANSWYSTDSTGLPSAIQMGCRLVLFDARIGSSGLYLDPFRVKFGHLLALRGSTQCDIVAFLSREVPPLPDWNCPCWKMIGRYSEATTLAGIAVLAVGLLWAPLGGWLATRLARSNGRRVTTWEGAQASLLFMLPWILMMAQLAGRPIPERALRIGYLLCFGVWLAGPIGIRGYPCHCRSGRICSLFASR